MSVGKKQPVICLDTGKVYASQRSAARDLGVTVTAINHVIVGRSIMVRGMKFRYATGDEIYEWNLSQPKCLDREEWKDLALELRERIQWMHDAGDGDDVKAIAHDAMKLLEGVI